MFEIVISTALIGRQRIFWSILNCLAVLLLIGCRAANNPVEPEAQTVPTVRVIRVGAYNVVKAIETIGTVAYRRELQLGFTTGGKTSFIRVQEGQHVAAGLALASLDTTVVQAELAQALAERERAAVTYSRTSALAAKGWVNRKDLDGARTALLSADARVRAAQFQRSSATIYAPSSGVVLARMAEPGQVVEAGRPILSFGDKSSGLVIRGAVTGSDASRVVIGSVAVVTINASNPLVLSGKVIEVGGKADATTGTFLVEVALPPGSGVRSGQVGTIRLQPESAVQAGSKASIPLEALFSARGGEGFVLVYDQMAGKVYNRKVVLGDLSDSQVEVRDGLRIGEIVAVSHGGTVSNGQSVRVAAAPGT